MADNNSVSIEMGDEYTVSVDIEDRLSGLNMVKSGRPTIGFIITWGLADNDFSIPIWWGAMDAAEKLGVNLIGFGDADFYNQDIGPSVYPQLSPGNLDGIIIVNPTFPELPRKLFGSLPVINITMQAEDVSTSIMCDNEKGIQAAISHLIEVHGRRHIAFIRGPFDAFDANARFKAYKETLEKYGITFDEKLVFDGGSDGFVAKTGVLAIRELIDNRRVAFDALVSSSDRPALAALQELSRRGIHVPNDIALTGFDDRVECQTVTPALTTVAQPLQRMGEKAVELMLNVIEGKKVEPLYTVNAELVVRRSCGCFTEPVKLAGNTGSGMGTGFLSGLKALENKEGELAFLFAGKIDVDGRKELTGICRKIVQGLISAVRKGKAEFFLSRVEDLMHQMHKGRLPLDRLQDSLSLLRNNCLAVTRASIRDKLENLFHQSRVLVTEGMQQQQLRYQVSERQITTTQRALSQQMGGTFEIDKLMDILFNDLGQLNIPGCYVFLFEGTERPAVYSRLILAVCDGKRHDLPEGGLRCPADRLFPPGLYPDKRRSLVQETLFFQNEELGYIIFIQGPRDGALYAALSGQIGSALKGALLYQAMTRMTETITEVALGAESQADMLANASRAIEEMMALIDGASRAVERTLGATETAADVAREGEETVSANMDRMRQLKTAIDKSATYVREMGDRSHQIRDFVATIDDISSQTGILAINAAITAARAGAQGKSFSIVAAEIRNLAMKAVAATTHISALVKDILSTVSLAVEGMESATGEAETGVNLSSRAGRALKEIMEAVEMVNQQMHTMRESARNLSIESKKVTQSVQHASSLSQNNKSAAQEVIGTAEKMKIS
ncbi:MAG: substrate-binding domain-containing protein [Spirochaetales bacterium]|nr:substrate-binding domain-containing protein [Spirochaetales bacterium]